jgi:Outer membrane protein beta-barrel domain
VKLKFLILLLLLNFSVLFSQTEKQIFTLKPSIGLSGAQIHGDNYSGFNKAGIFGGVAVNAFLNKKCSIEMGFYFSQKGARHNPNPEKGDYSFYYVNLNYLDMPILFRYHLNKDYYISGGPSIAYLLSYHEETERGDWTGDYPFESFEYGVNIGMGKKIKEKFSVEVRSSNSFMPIRSYGVIANLVFYPNAVARAFNRGLYNNVLTFLITYKIDLKRKTIEPKS